MTEVVNGSDVDQPGKAIDLNLNFNEKKSVGRAYLELLLNKLMRIVISDGRTLIGQFLCTDHDENIILGSCQEYIGSTDDSIGEEPRLLGLAMIPGRHVVSMHIDMDKQLEEGVQKLKENQTETEADKKTESKEPDDINSETIANPQNPNGKCDGDKSIKT